MYKQFPLLDTQAGLGLLWHSGSELTHFKWINRHNKFIFEYGTHTCINKIKIVIKHENNMQISAYAKWIFVVNLFAAKQNKKPFAIKRHWYSGCICMLYCELAHVISPRFQPIVPLLWGMADARLKQCRKTWKLCSEWVLLCGDANSQCSLTKGWKHNKQKKKTETNWV